VTLEMSPATAQPESHAVPASDAALPLLAKALAATRAANRRTFDAATAKAAELKQQLELEQRRAADAKAKDTFLDEKEAAVNSCESRVDLAAREKAAAAQTGQPVIDAADAVLARVVDELAAANKTRKRMAQHRARCTKNIDDLETRRREGAGGWDAEDMDLHAQPWKVTLAKYTREGARVAREVAALEDAQTQARARKDEQLGLRAEAEAALGVANDALDLARRAFYAAVLPGSLRI
jgi:hypothetical protein